MGNCLRHSEECATWWSWTECVELGKDLRDGKPGTNGRIEKVNRVDFTDIIQLSKSRGAGKQKEEIQLVKTVMEKILHLERCRMGSWYGEQLFATANHCKIIQDVLNNVTVGELFILPAKDIFSKSGTLRFLSRDKDFAHRLAKLCEVCQVKKLHMGDCNLQSDQLKSFVKRAKDTKIVKINVTDNPDISEEDEKKLVEFLENNRRKETEVDATGFGNAKKSPRVDYEAHLGDALVYTIEQHRRKGKVLIINNEFKGTTRMRKGSLVDIQNQEDLWKEFGFGVTVKKDLTSATMRRTCNEFNRKLRNVSVVIVIIMTHGKMENEKEWLEGEDGQFILTDDVVSTFNAKNAPHLYGIPKAFFFQACRGMNRDLSLGTDASPALVLNFPERSDMLIAHPTQAGFVSFRNETDGTWFMNAVANVFRERAHDTHVVDMLTMVNDSVAKKESNDREVQMCNYESYLRKRLYLFPGWPN